jgi:peptidoglycan/LPS O-acetylase OafA/YrhL
MPVLSRFLLMKTVGLTLPEKTLPVSGLALLLTIMIASLSWHLFERPINDLKRYF